MTDAASAGAFGQAERNYGRRIADGDVSELGRPFRSLNTLLENASVRNVQLRPPDRAG